MEGKKLTEGLIKTAKRDNFLYAEISDRNAMGQPGIARLYTLTNGKLELYVLDVNNTKNEGKQRLFNDFYDVLMKMARDELLIFQKAGYGNFAWKKIGTHFERDDKNNTFIYKKGDKTYKLESLNPGLYQGVAGRFADRDLDYSILYDYLTKNRKKIKTADELAFVNMYSEVIRKADADLPIRRFTVDDYWIAIKYLRWHQLEDFNISNEDRINGIENIARYRLRLIVNQIGWRKIDEIFVNLIKMDSGEIFKEFNKYLFEPIETFFDKVDYTNADLDDPFAPEDIKGSILYYAKYPLLLNILPKVFMDIVERIAKMSGAELEENAMPISYFLASFILGEQRIPYTVVLPAALHIVKEMPSSGDESKHLDHLYWLACEVINNAWKFLEEKDDAQNKFKKMVYEAFWPRFGSLWPIENYLHFKFESEMEQNIYDEALGWLMSIDDIDTRNKEIRDYLDRVIKNNEYPARSVFRRATIIALRENTPEEKYEKIINLYKPEAYPDVLHYPESVEEAKCLLDDLFNPNGHITNLNRIRMFEQLLINPNSIGVGEYILNYIKDNFDKFVEILTNDSVNANLGVNEVITSIVTAIAKGITEENELAPYKAICKKALDCNVDGKILDAASTYARNHRKEILFQRSALQKYF